MTIALVIAALLMGLALGIAVVAFKRPEAEAVTRWPGRHRTALPAGRPHDAGSTFATELREIGVTAGPEYRSGEYPTVEVEAVEPAEQAPIPDARPWLTPTLHTEPTPLFHATGSYPVLEVDLSYTNSWNRSDLLRRLGMDEGAAA